jgi:hypothetical protein
MTPARRAEMRYYRQLAMTMEAQPQGWTRKDNNNKRNSVDSGNTMLKDTEHASSGHHLCTNRGIVNDSAGEMESTLTTSGNSAPLNSSVIKKLVPCNELKPRTVTNANLRSVSVSMLGTFQQDILQSDCVVVMEPTQQHVVQNDSNETENGSVTLDARETEGLCIRTQDFSVQNSKIKGVLKVSDKCDLENMRHSCGFSLTDNVFGSDYIVYKPWDKVHNSNNNNEGHRVKPHQENISGVNGNRKRPEQVVTESGVNVNLVQSAQRKWVKNDMHHCLIDSSITPIIHGVKLNSLSLLSGTDDHGQKYRSDDNISDSRSESVNCKVFTHQNEIHSENSLEHVELQPEINSTFFLHSQKAEKPNVPVQDIPCLSKRAYNTDDISKPVEICEEVVDITKGVWSESCGNEDSLRFNIWESDGRVIMNKYNILKHNSPESTDFSGLADVSSSTPHLLMHENLEDSVSSAAMTSSTDLNHYMNITGSSSSGSPGRDVATLHNCKWSGQDVLHSTSNIVALQKSLLTKNNTSGQNLLLLTSRESNFISNHSSLTDQTEAQKYKQNFVCDKLGTGLNKDSACVVEELVVQNDSPGDLIVSSMKGCPVNVDFAVCTAKTFNEKNINCHVRNQAKCITIPKLKLHHNKFSDEHDDSETSAIPVHKCVHDSNNTEENVKKTNECGILKPEATPPRLVRQNSYTLDSPSPVLVAHMMMKKGKNSVHDMTESSGISPKPRRKAWDIMRTESNKKKGKSLFALLNEKAKSSKKIQSSIHASFTGHQDRHNSSLPASNTSSPIKLQTPFASVDCLPSAVSTESVKTFPHPSTTRKNKGSFKDSTSSVATKKINKPRTLQKKSPTKILRKKNLCAASQENLKKISKAEFVPLSSHQDIQGLILHMQSEHSQQMAELLAKQRKEQEELREAFLRQQNELMLDIHNVYSTAFCAPESHKLLAQEILPCDLSASCENGSFNSSISLIPSDLPSKSMPLGGAGTLETSHDMHDKCILSDTNLERFQTSISASVEKDQNVADNSLYQDLLLGKTQGSSDMTVLLEESSHVNVSVKEVTQNALQNCSPLRLSEPDTTEAHLLIYSSHPHITVNMGTQVLAPLQLGLLQKHNNDSGEENTYNKDDTLNTSCTVLPLSHTSQVISNVPASDTVALLGNMKHSLQRREVDFSHSSVPISPPVRECNTVESKDRQTDSIEGHSACIRQLFPAHEESGALHHIPPLSSNELENVSSVF